MINLPINPVKATSVNPSLLLIYGLPKIGKTPSMLMLENNLLLDLEGRARFFDGLWMKVDSLSHLEQIGQAIIEAGRPYKYITIDTITVLEEWIEPIAKNLYLASPICKREYKANPNLLSTVTALPDGAGWQWIRVAYGQAFNYIRTLADNIILIAHVRDKMLVDKNGLEVGSADLALTGKLKQITCGKSDAIGYLYRVTKGSENGKPISQMRINFNSNTEIICGATSKHLRGQDFDFCPEQNPKDWEKIFLPEEN